MKDIDVQKLLEIGIALSSEKDSDSLLEHILTSAMDITGCDGGTLYIKDGARLDFRIMITRSKGFLCGGRHGPINLPPVPLTPANVCACAALDGRLINIPDAYGTSVDDFEGPRSYDAMTGYQTVSMLVVPMEDDRGEIIGVVQLINALDECGNVISFDPGYEEVIRALGSQAAICLTNMNYAHEVRELLESFARVMSTAIDARMPYNANHTRGMVRDAGRFLAWLDRHERGWRFTGAQKHEFLLAVWMHDIGKLAIPSDIMDKDTRLGNRLDGVLGRFRAIALLDRVALLENGISGAEYARRADVLREALSFVHTINRGGRLSDDDYEAVQALAARTYLDEQGRVQPWLTEDERVALSIREGTLTAEERAVMEGHVTMTARMLSEMKFTGDYAGTPVWAAGHHEMLDGSGYPQGLRGEEIPRETRLLTILDIFNALTACDRPYKPALPVNKALAILHDMADGGKLDGAILALFEESRAWEGSE